MYLFFQPINKMPIEPLTLPPFGIQPFAIIAEIFNNIPNKNKNKYLKEQFNLLEKRILFEIAKTLEIPRKNLCKSKTYRDILSDDFWKNLNINQELKIEIQKYINKHKKILGALEKASLTQEKKENLISFLNDNYDRIPIKEILEILKKLSKEELKEFDVDIFNYLYKKIPNELFDFLKENKKIFIYISNEIEIIQNYIDEKDKGKEILKILEKLSEEELEEFYVYIFNNLFEKIPNELFDFLKENKKIFHNVIISTSIIKDYINKRKKGKEILEILKLLDNNLRLDFFKTFLKTDQVIFTDYLFSLKDEIFNKFVDEGYLENLYKQGYVDIDNKIENFFGIKPKYYNKNKKK